MKSSFDQLTALLDSRGAQFRIVHHPSPAMLSLAVPFGRRDDLDPGAAPEILFTVDRADVAVAVRADDYVRIAGRGLTAAGSAGAGSAGWTGRG